MKKNSVFLLLILLPLISCGGDGRKEGEIYFGRDLDSNGRVEFRDMEYEIAQPQYMERIKTWQDLYNHIYFEGDTLCFQVPLENPEDYSDIKGTFILASAKGEVRYAVERIDRYEKGIAGFSLIGSLLEARDRENLSEPVRALDDCCAEVPFSLVLEMRGKEERTLKTDGLFRVRFIDR